MGRARTYAAKRKGQGMHRGAASFPLAASIFQPGALLQLAPFWAVVGIFLCLGSMGGKGLGTEPPMSTLILFEGKIKNSKTSGLLMPAKRVLSEPPVSIGVPGA